MENARSGVGLQGETLLLDIRSLEIIIERETGFLAALSLRSYVGLLQRRLVDLELIFVWPSLVSGSLFVHFGNVFHDCGLVGWWQSCVLRLLLDLLE
jgi:hypothetical protein